MFSSEFFWSKSGKVSVDPKMSDESELTRDKNGFLKCKNCPRWFLTETMFEYHSSNQHKKETETKLNQNHLSQTIKV